MKRLLSISILTTLLSLQSLFAFSATADSSNLVSLEMHTLRCNVGDILQIKEKPVTDSVAAPSAPQWVSGNPEIMEIDSRGVAKALANGNVTIRLTDRGITDSCTIQISDQYLQKRVLRTSDDLRNFAKEGFIEYNGILVLRGNTLTSTRLLNNQLTKVTALIINNCHNLEDFSGLHNLQTVDVLYFNKADVTSLKDFGNQLTFNELDIKDSHLKGFEGLSIAPFLNGSNKINISNSSVDSFKGFEQLKSFEGDISIQKSILHNFKGLDSLESIIGQLTIDSTKLDSLPFIGLGKIKHILNLNLAKCQFKNFKGLENLQSLSETMMLQSDHIGSFDGLNELEYIGNNFDIKKTMISSFDGLPKLKQVGNNFTIENTSISNHCVNGLDSLQTIGTFSISHTDLSSLKGMKGLRTICKKTILDSSNVNDFEGLEQLNTFGKTFIVENCHIHSFNGLKSIKQIENLQIENSNFESLNGINKFCKIRNLDIEESNIKNFEGIGICINRENLKIKHCAVNNMYGLQGIQTLNNLELEDDDISSLQSLNQIQRINKTLTIENLPYLRNFVGLKRLTTIGKKLVLKNLQLNSFEGLNNLQKIGLTLSLDNTNIQNFEGLDNLSVLCNLNIKNESQLSNFGGFDSLKQLTAYSYSDSPQIDIRKCSVLTDYRLLKPIIAHTHDIEFTFKKNAYNPTEEDLNKDLWYKPVEQRDDE